MASDFKKFMKSLVSNEIIFDLNFQIFILGPGAWTEVNSQLTDDVQF